jgi:hypothetical protein
VIPNARPTALETLPDDASIVPILDERDAVDDPTPRRVAPHRVVSCRVAPHRVASRREAVLDPEVGLPDPVAIGTREGDLADFERVLPAAFPDPRRAELTLSPGDDTMSFPSWLHDGPTRVETEYGPGTVTVTVAGRDGHYRLRPGTASRPRRQAPTVHSIQTL